MVNILSHTRYYASFSDLLFFEIYLVIHK